LAQQASIAVGSRPNRGLYWFAILLAGLTVVLLLAGALVTSNEAGDSVPDWPLSFGRWLIHSDHFVANVRYEYSHRLLAGMVGAGTFILALWVHFSERRSWMRRLAWAAFAGVAAQALVGGVRVLLPGYKPFIAVPHALIAQSFFGLIVSIAVFTSRSWWTPRAVTVDSEKFGLRLMTRLTIAAVLLQLVLGAGFRHRAFGILPHVLGAAVVVTLLVWTAALVIKRHGSDGYLRRPAVTALALLAVQVALGISAYFARLASLDDPQPLEPMISLTVAHLVVGALTLATVVVLTLRCYRALAPARRRAEGVAGAQAEQASPPRRATV
jgi:cytochrome c oxidase assembly protein subunit 15